MKKYLNLDEQKICEMYKNGQSVHQIEKILSISNSPIRRVLKENKIITRKVGYPQKYSCNENIFKEESEESFYLAGFIAADGNLREQKYSKVLKIALSEKDAIHLENIKKILQSNHPLKKYKVKISPLIKKNTTSNKTYKSIELTITSSIIFEDLAKFNIVPNKTATYIMPEWLKKHNLVRHFIRGYFDGDGSVCSSIVKRQSHPQVSFSLIGNYDLLNTIDSIFIKECSINGSKIIHKPKTKHTYRIRYHGNIQSKKIGNFLYKNSKFYLERKFEKFKTLNQ